MDTKGAGELAQAAQLHDTAALAELLERCKPLIYKIACLYGAFDEDCYQHLTLAAIEAIFNFDPNFT